MPSWYAAYIALAILNFLALTSSLILNYRQEQVLSESTANYRVYVDLLDQVNVVGNCAIGVGSVASAIFATRDVDRAQANLASAAAEFERQYAVLRRLIGEQLPSETRSNIERSFPAIDYEWAALRSEAQKTLEAFAAGNFIETARHAGLRTQHFAGFVTAMMSVARNVRRSQLEIIDAQQSHTHEAYRFGLWLVVGASLVTVAVFLHARRVRRTMLSQKQQRDEFIGALAEARDQAEHAARVKAQFLANMSHEIRTPMNGVLGMLDALSNTRLTLDQAKLLRTANTSADLLLSIIDDVLDFSKIEAGMLIIESTPLDLVEVIQHVQSLYGVRAAEKLLALKCELPEKELPRVFGDKTRITQLLSNLVSNAIKFTVAGEVAIKLSVVSEDSETVRIRFDIRDTGIGLDEDAQARLFAPFMQADTSTSRRYGGTGLGLAICKQLVALLDKKSGEIGVESAVGRGSTFYFVLNLRKASGEKAAETAPRKDDASTPAHFVGHVLVAEDNETNQQVIETMLRNLGLRVTIATNGRDAVDSAQSEHFDLILMDYHMPELDGCDATAEIRRYEAESKISRTPIVAVTASVLKEDKDRCIASGVDDFLAKPIRQRTLAATLEKWLPTISRRFDVAQQEAAIGPCNWSELPSEHFDLEQLLEMRGVAGDTFTTLLEQFHGSAREGITAMRAAISTGDAIALRRAAHKLKGAATTLGVKVLAGHCHALEKMGMEQRTDAAPERLATLEREYGNIRRLMEACTESMSPAA